MKTKVVLALMVLALAGCGGRPGGLKDAMAYDAKSLTHVKMPDDVYRIFEHPSRDRLMTTTSIGKAAGQGFVRGATLGLATVQTPEQLHEAAARKYLSDTGRGSCVILSGYELITTQYEFKFDCGGQTPVAKSTGTIVNPDTAPKT
jgi:hypothetical protein